MWTMTKPAHKSTRWISVFGIAAMALPLAAQQALAGAQFGTSTQTARDPHPHQVSQLTAVRFGDHGSFDRIVFDEATSVSGYSVKYTPKLTADPSGKTIQIKGQYILHVSMPDSVTSNLPNVITPGLAEVVQIKKAGEFERVVSFGIGLRHYRAFRVLRLTSPPRVVIDVLH